MQPSRIGNCWGPSPQFFDPEKPEVKPDRLELLVEKHRGPSGAAVSLEGLSPFDQFGTMLQRVVEVSGAERRELDVSLVLPHS